MPSTALAADVKRYPESQTHYLAVTVIVVVVQEPTYPAGRLCEVMLWPPGPTVLTLVVNPELLQMDWARFNRSLLPVADETIDQLLNRREFTRSIEGANE